MSAYRNGRPQARLAPKASLWRLLGAWARGFFGKLKRRATKRLRLDQGARIEARLDGVGVLEGALLEVQLRRPRPPPTKPGRAPAYAPE
jgi:hypothetical protein